MTYKPDSETGGPDALTDPIAWLEKVNAESLDAEVAELEALQAEPEPDATDPVDAVIAASNVWIAEAEASAGAWTGKSPAERAADLEFRARMQHRIRFEIAVIRAQQALERSGGTSLRPERLAHLWQAAQA
jgi:hypothetical protein